MADSENEGDAESREPPEGFLEPGYITYRGRGKMWEQLQKRRREKEQREAADEE